MRIPVLFAVMALMAGCIPIGVKTNPIGTGITPCAAEGSALSCACQALPTPFCAKPDARVAIWSERGAVLRGDG